MKKISFPKIISAVALFVLISIPFAMLLFANKFGPARVKGLAIDVGDTVSGTRESRTFSSVKVTLHNFSESTIRRVITVYTEDFSLVDTLGNPVGTLDFTGITTPQLPQTFSLNPGGDQVFGYVTFVDTGENFDEGFLVYKSKESSRVIKIPVNFKLPVTY